MNRVPLFVLLPLGAAVMVGVIGVSIGLLNLWINDTFSPDMTIAFAGTLTVLIMIGAYILSRSSPDPEDTSGDHEH